MKSMCGKLDFLRLCLLDAFVLQRRSLLDRHLLSLQTLELLNNFFLHYWGQECKITVVSILKRFASIVRFETTLRGA